MDGFVATAAHTLLVQEDASAPVTGRHADVLAAGNTALEAAIRLIRPGKAIADVAGPLGTIAESYGCSLVSCPCYLAPMLPLSCGANSSANLSGSNV